MASSDEQSRTPSTALHVDITYRLLYECIIGQDPNTCSNIHDHFQIEDDDTSYLKPLLPSNSEYIPCRVQFTWANYSGDLIGPYDRVQDTLFSLRLLQETLQSPTGADRAISDVKITFIKEYTKDGTLVENGGRYVRLNVHFTGFPTLSAKVWGKRVTGGVDPGTVQMSMEEKLRLGIEGSEWNWKAD